MPEEEDKYPEQTQQQTTLEEQSGAVKQDEAGDGEEDEEEEDNDDDEEGEEEGEEEEEEEEEGEEEGEEGDDEDNDKRKMEIAVAAKQQPTPVEPQNGNAKPRQLKQAVEEEKPAAVHKAGGKKQPQETVVQQPLSMREVVEKDQPRKELAKSPQQQGKKSKSQIKLAPQQDDSGESDVDDNSKQQPDGKDEDEDEDEDDVEYTPEKEYSDDDNDSEAEQVAPTKKKRTTPKSPAKRAAQPIKKAAEKPPVDQPKSPSGRQARTTTQVSAAKTGRQSDSHTFSCRRAMPVAVALTKCNAAAASGAALCRLWHCIALDQLRSRKQPPSRRGGARRTSKSRAKGNLRSVRAEIRSRQRRSMVTYAHAHTPKHRHTHLQWRALIGDK